ncbi:MurR/RpiR family transcriptional regulator [Shouchella clausii]|uniref:RpiR family transcriptional regulator n=3 Tax=Shouchella TaxID=2893057 RepID=Q5WLA8_SHOC1|nr:MULTISPECIES: MurR/RpiR family transcriptional regulator [Shouchella]MCM3314255.1 MurR/RpiR family transcriptional regulator [Psychrobacillus sp. MER TA 17]ALA52589.1 Sialic acid utilization regulator, RpiR family [Shouchella clausii]MBU3230004.1 MurR/RpiR family transcriptional regulator [Shouchella clausii]MBU3262797.1 MurR/RpiR family transcriptional regulator [Shouchella clausii]MBU3506887.1 MurR/RpiR family transcriptional regulator [Shouchella clausii]
MGSLLAQIEKELESLSEAEARIGQTILDSPSQIPSMTTKELSARAGVSEASVIRFCKKIGINSFRLFKMELMKDVTASKERLTDFSSLQEKDAPYDLFRRVTFTNKSAIELSLSSIDRKQLEAAVAVLMTAKRIVFYGVGGSAAAAFDGSYKFTRIGYQASSSQDFHYNLSLIPYMEKGDIFVAISLSGKTQDVVELATFAKKQGVTVVAITKMDRSPLYRLADITLCTPNVEEDFRIGTIASRMTQLNIIDTLYLSVFHEKDEDTITAFLKARDEALRLRR